MALKLGNSAKDSKYLKRIKDAIENDKEHPRHHGVKMQAHHLISGEGMKISTLGKKIEKFGYDINLLPNLVFIPSTLQGACYLGVQPHRGNHTALIDQDDYDDDQEPIKYHDMVSRRLLELKLPLSKECPGDNEEKRKKVIGELNGLSENILKLIQNDPKAAPLTVIAKFFSPGNHIGCGSVDSVGQNKGLIPCAVKRNHHKNQASNQDRENISYVNKGEYKLSVGR